MLCLFPTALLLSFCPSHQGHHHHHYHEWSFTIQIHHHCNCHQSYLAIHRKVSLVSLHYSWLTLYLLRLMEVCHRREMDYFGKRSHLKLSFSLSEGPVANLVQFFKLNLLDVILLRSWKRYDLNLDHLNRPARESVAIYYDQNLNLKL